MNHDSLLKNADSAASGVPSSVEVWAKVQPGGAVALLAINTAAKGDANLSVDLSQVLPVVTPGWCTSKPCKVRDIWCGCSCSSSQPDAAAALHISSNASPNCGLIRQLLTRLCSLARPRKETTRREQGGRQVEGRRPGPARLGLRVNHRTMIIY